MPKRTLLASLALLAAVAQAQTPNPKILDRYKQMLSANPAEGIALERLWKAAVDSGTTDGLIREYREKHDFSGRMILGLLLRKAGRDAEAVGVFTEAAAVDPKNAAAGLAIARLEMDRGQPRAAAGWLEKVIQNLPAGDSRLSDTLLQLGTAWLGAGDATKAAESWERVIALAPGNLEIRRKLANAYAENFLTASAIRHFEYLAEHAAPADRAAALQQIAKLHSSAGSPGKALEALERAVSFTAPGNWLRSELLGQMVRLAQRQNAEAELEQKWKSAAEANPRDLGAVLRMIELYDRLGKLEQQIAWLEKVCVQLPRADEYRLKLARALAQSDQLDKAAAEFDKLIAAQPTNVDFAFERARIDVQQENFEAARKRVVQLVALKPGDDALRGKALQFYQENRFFDLVEESLKSDAVSGDEERVLALANFYFSQRRKEDAQAVLARLLKNEDPLEKQANAQFRIAETLRSQGELAASMEALQAALRLQPARREFHLFRGELEMALRRFDEARDAFARVYALSGNDAERLEADSKAFETYRAEAAMEDGGENPRARANMPARVERFIHELMRAASEQKDAANWLRVARWKAWNSDRASAVTFAAKAAELAPKDTAPREFLARLAITNGDASMGLFYLRQLVTLNPAKRSVYLREIAQLEMQRGEHRAALEINEALAKDSPGDPDALSDFAAAQERAGQLQLALETWKKVLAVSPAPRRREAGASLLRVLQRLGRHHEASQWLLRAVDETPDEKEKSRRFDELLLHAKQHELLASLKEEFEARRKRRADDYFTAMALGRVLKLMGDKEGAFDLFADAVFSAPDQVEALPELVREAEDLRRLDVAVRLQEQLTRVSPQPTGDDLLKLAFLHFKTGDLEGAEQAWIRAVARFPRDTEVARRAVEFHKEWGDAERASALLRKIVALEPADVRSALEWGELEYRAGKFAEAQSAFEIVMKLTRPVAHRFYPAALPGGPWSERGLFAGTARVGRSLSEPLQLASAWRSVPSNTTTPVNVEAELRLRAISRLSAIAQRQGGQRQAAWIADWTAAKSAQPTDALWALYFSGAQSTALQEVLADFHKDPQIEGPRQAFIWMALESGAWTQLREWIGADGRSEKDLDWFSEAFAAMIVRYPEKLNAAMLDGLFPDGRSTRVWTSAVELGKQQRFAEALMLGRRVWDKVPTQRMYIGREIARWHLALGQTAEARDILRAVAFLPADSLEAAPCLALHDVLSLLPENERAPFLKERLASIQGDMPDALIARFACHLFSGDEKAARAALQELVAQHPLATPGLDESNGAIRSWSFLLGTHRQLVAWDRPDLARAMWEPLFADPGLLAWWRAQKVRQRVEGGEGLTAEEWVNKPVFAGDEKRAREAVELIEFALGGPVERGRLKDQARSRGGAALEKLGDRIDSQGMRGAAADTYFQAWGDDRNNPGLLRKALTAAQQSGDAKLSEDIRKLCLDQRLNPGNDTSPREFAIELADVLARRGAIEESIQVLESARKRSADFRILDKLAHYLEWEGRSREAEGVWIAAAKGGGGSAQDRHVVASRLEARGKFGEALAARSAGGASGDPQVPVLLYKLGRADDAVLALEKIIGEQAVYTAMVLAEHMGLKGEDKLARSVLLATAARAQQPRAQMQLRSKLLTVPGAAPSASLVRRVQSKLRELETQNPELAEPYFEFFQTYAERFGIAQPWRAELVAAWAHGTGPLAAGMALARAHLEAKELEPSRRVLEAIVGRGDASSATLSRAASLAADGKFNDVRLRIAEIQGQQGWPFAQPTFDAIRLMDRLGQRERGRDMLARMDWLTAYPGGSAMIAQAWLDFGDPERARGYFQRALQQDVFQENPSELAGMARVQIAAKRLPAARLLLARAFSMRSCREFPALIEYLAATNSLRKWRDVAREFGLSQAAEFDLTLALFAHFEREGRLTDALALIAENPRIVVPLRAWGDLMPAEAVICDRLRAWARRSGNFPEVARILDLLVSTGLSGAEAGRAALEADRAAAANEPALPHLAKAAELAPTIWTHSRSLAEAQLVAGQKRDAQATLERFLSVSLIPFEREAALSLWQKARQ